MRVMPLTRFAISILAVLLGAGPVFGGDAITPKDVTGPVAWGGVQAHGLRHLRFSGQPDERALKEAKEAGVAVVINLRDPDEDTWPEAAVAAELGLRYYNVPVKSDEAFSPAAFEKIEALVAEHPGETTLIHCASGNRAAGWLATHLVTRHHLSEGDALAVARQAGLTSDAIAGKVEQYLGKSVKLDHPAEPEPHEH